MISPSPARGNQLNFRFYRVPQDAINFCAPGALMESVPCGTDSQTAAASAAAWTEMHRWGGNGRGKPTAGWFSMSGQKAAKELRDALVLPAHGAGIRIVTYGLWTRFETRVSLIPALAGIKEGISRPAGRDSGQRCPRVRALAERVGHSLAGKRPTGAFSDSARFEKGLSESFN